jgi:hypothetical protein
MEKVIEAVRTNLTQIPDLREALLELLQTEDKGR